MRWEADRWVLDLLLNEVGFFEYKAYLTDAQGTSKAVARWSQWRHCRPPQRNPERQYHLLCLDPTFGNIGTNPRPGLNALTRTCDPDADGYAVIPPSGKNPGAHRTTPAHCRYPWVPHHPSAADQSNADHLRPVRPIR